MTETDERKTVTTSFVLWIMVGVPVLVISAATIGGSMLLAPYKGMIAGLVVLTVVAPVTSFRLAKRLAQKPQYANRSVTLRAVLLTMAQWLLALSVGTMEGCIAILARV